MSPTDAATARNGPSSRERPEEPRTWQREFEQVALVHSERLYRLALGLCRNRTDADDLVQETFLRAFRRFDRFSPGTNSLAALERALAGVADRAPATPEEEFLRSVVNTRLAQAVGRLPQCFREVLLLPDIEGCRIGRSPRGASCRSEP